MLISIDGCDGTGKTTQARLLKDYLCSIGYKTVISKEPGNPNLKECCAIRKIILDPDFVLDKKTELLLFLADRAQNVDRFIKPMLEKNINVICDRYIDSTIVYQLKNRSLDSDFSRKMIEYASHGIMPDLTFILDLDVETGLTRAKKSNTEFVGGDRMEREQISFHNKLRDGFLEIAGSHDRYVVLDSSGTIEDLHKEIIQIVTGRLK